MATSPTPPAVDATLSPQVKAGIRRARYAVRLDNRGSDAVALAVDGLPGGGVELTTHPSLLTLSPGRSAETALTVHARTLLWVGRPVRTLFHISVTRACEDTIATVPATVLDGTFTQRPLLPLWLLALLVLLTLWAALAATG